jgi:clan AA aspartic protease (TIGR02281 family)
MRRLFTVQWPVGARAEAVLLFIAAVLLLRFQGLVGSFESNLTRWGLAAGIAAVAFMGMLVAVDRLLSIRKGIALSAVLATAAWTGAGVLAVPAYMRGVVVWPVLAVALVAHAAPLSAGLRDRGVVGTRLAVADDPKRKRSGFVRVSLVLLAILPGTGYLFRHRIVDALWRLDAVLPFGPSMTAGPDQAIAVRQADGWFVFDTTANGVSIPMTYDPSAGFVVLTMRDAERLGYKERDLRFSLQVRMGKGWVDVSELTIDNFKVGGIAAHNVTANVVRNGVLARSVLGESFLRRLASTKILGDRLILQGRDPLPH